jgi:PHD/YefM family antitoxin component YafN of YafNO toxin-antitoxin module
MTITSLNLRESQAFLESLEETLDIMRDPELVDSLRKSRAEAEAGLVFPLRDLLDTS